LNDFQLMGIHFGSSNKSDNFGTLLEVKLL